jgi:glyoxylase-like metal-dependent hydrolase (beta-lactamase superfamily II)
MRPDPQPSIPALEGRPDDFFSGVPQFQPVTPHIWRLSLPWHLRLPLVPPIPVAVWLVKAGQDWTIVDAAHPSHAAIVPKAAGRLLGLARPARVVLTHAHIDHGGSLRALIQRWDLPVWVHLLEAGFVSGEKSYRRVESSSLVFNLARSLLREVAWNVPVAQTLQEGDRVGEMEVIHVPGHSPGMIALHHHEDRAILCGDTFMNLGGRLSAAFALATPDPQQARQSMEKLAGLDFDLLLPSHDASPHGIPAAVVRRFVSRH